MNVAWMVWPILGGRDTQILITGKNILNCMHSQAAGKQKHSDFPELPRASASTRTIHLVNLSLPNIWNIYRYFIPIYKKTN